MAKVTPGFKLYLYQLLSRELGFGKQTLLPQVEEVLAADDLLMEDFECKTMQELAEACPDFLKVRVFKKGRVYVTVGRNEEWDQMLAAPTEKAAPAGKKSAGGPKTWKKKKGGKKSFKPVKPGKQRREREAAEAAAAAERKAAEAAAAAEREAAEAVAAEVAQETESAEEEASPETVAAPLVETPAEPQAEADEKPSKPMARTVAEIMAEARAQDAAASAEQPAAEAAPEPQAEPEPELAPEPEPTPVPETEVEISDFGSTERPQQVSSEFKRQR